MSTSRLASQIAFLVESDKLKNVVRRTLLTDSSRQENSAEHSWHLSLSAIVLREYASEPIDLSHVLKILVIHDIVEIDAGDTFAYDPAGNASKEARERKAADRIFSLLPQDLATDLRQLWEEFESQSTPEARFANAIDRIQAFLQNVANQGGTWKTHRLHHDQVIARMQPIRATLPGLWPMVLDALDRFFPIKSGGKAAG